MRRRLVTHTGLNFSDTLKYEINQEVFSSGAFFNRLLSRAILESSFDFLLLHVDCLKSCAI